MHIKVDSFYEDGGIKQITEKMGPSGIYKKVYEYPGASGIANFALFKRKN